MRYVALVEQRFRHAEGHPVAQQQKKGGAQPNRPRKLYCLIRFEEGRKLTI